MGVGSLDALEMEAFRSTAGILRALLGLRFVFRARREFGMAVRAAQSRFESEVCQRIEELRHGPAGFL